MKQILSLFFCLLSVTFLQAQCEKQNSAYLELVLDSMPDAKTLNQVRISLRNSADEDAIFCWYDLENTWGVPLAFDISVIDENGKLIHDRFNWSKYFSPTAFEAYKKKFETINISSGKVHSKEVILYWPGMLPGVYKVQLFSSKPPVLISNQISFKVK